MDIQTPIEGHPTLPATDMLHPGVLNAYKGKVITNLPGLVRIHFPNVSHAVSYADALEGHYATYLDVWGRELFDTTLPIALIIKPKALHY